MDAKTWNKLQKNREYITCFSQGGWQIKESNGLLQTRFKVKYQAQEEEWKAPVYNTNEITSLFSNGEPEVETIKPKVDTIPQIYISDFDAKKYEEFFEDGTLKLKVEVDDGLKDGNLKVYHSNGELYIKGEFKNDQPVGKWKYYDEEGDLIKVDRY
ncbi:MAG: hypothetical protein JEZ09_14085 [Salinivirgaceae bacterium]|nr:hypothetical protein [Salinivirgaceae bacterium]